MSGKAIIAAILLAFALGYSVHFLVDPSSENGASSIRQHWDVIDRYNAELSDPSNERSVDGMIGIHQFIDPLPALAALVSAGEIQHIDLVFPGVPNNSKTNAYWMQYVNEHDGIIYAEGNPSYVDFRPTGPQPLHLNLWFRESAADDVRQLIQNVESLVNGTNGLQ